MAGESDVTNLAGFARFNQCRIRSLRMKDAVRIVESDFMVLGQINVIDP